MAKLNGGDIIMKAVRREGVENVFALSGDHVQAIFDACLDEEIRMIDVRHEQAAVHMADGWARVTRRPGVAVVTAGPGVVDTIPGVATAFQQGSPVVVLAGRTPFSDFDTGFGQDINQCRLLYPVTKWAATCYEIERLPQYVSQAFRHALTPPYGPAFLDVPSDVQEAEVEEERINFIPDFAPARTAGDPAAVERAINLLAQARRPIIIAGSGVWWAGAAAELREFAELTGIPVLLSQMGRGALPEDHPLCFGAFRAGTREADVVLVLGARLNRWLGRGQPPLFGTDQRWIQVDINPAEIGRNRPIDIGIVGDVKEVLRQFLELAKGKVRADEAWVKSCREYVEERRHRIEKEATAHKKPIHPLRLCREIEEFLPKERILSIDGGDIAVFAAMVLKSYLPGHWLDTGNIGLLGSGIPFGIAAKLAYPEKPVLVLTGDGSFGFNAMEMDTAIRHRVPVVVVIANDGAWGMIKHRQEIIYGRVVGTELGFTRYDKMVEALGGYGEVVEEPGEIAPALERAFASGVPACINVLTDPTAVSPVTQRTATRRG